MFTRHCSHLLAAVVVLGCGDRESGIVAPRWEGPALSSHASGSSARGHASVTQQPSGELRTFSFTARVMPDGSVKGEYVNHNRQGDAVNHGEIDCLRLIGANGAVMSGPIRKHTNPAFEGFRSIVRVEDNGEGNDDPPDRVGMLNLVASTSTLDCQTFTPQILIPLEGGNIQVTP